MIARMCVAGCAVVDSLDAHCIRVFLILETVLEPSVWRILHRADGVVAFRVSAGW